MKLNNIKTKNEAGEVGEFPRAEYIKHIVASQEVKAYETEENGVTPPNKVVDFILKTIEGGQEMDPGLASEYGALINVIEADVKLTAENAEDKKAAAEKAKAEKAAELAAKKAKEEEAKKELALGQDAFAKSALAGATTAAEEYKEEVADLIGSLPKGVDITKEGNGYGVKFADDATKETIGQTLGYLHQKSENSNFIGNQLQFWIGDTIKVAVERGIYSTASEAGKHIAGVISAATGKEVQAISLDQYKRMAERTPIELRNAQADQTAYLAISQMKAPKPDKGEKDEAFKIRLDEFTKDREALQTKLAVGEITKRKDILPEVQKVLVKHGLRKAEEENPGLSVGQLLTVFFHASFALEDLLGAQKPDVVEYKDATDVITVTKEKLEETKADAYAKLTAAFYTSAKDGFKPEDFIRGYVEKIVPTKVGEDADGKPIMQDEKVKNIVRPRPFFESPKKDEAPAPAATEGNAADA